MKASYFVPRINPSIDPELLAWNPSRKGTAVMPSIYYKSYSKRSTKVPADVHYSHVDWETENSVSFQVLQRSSTELM